MLNTRFILIGIKYWCKFNQQIKTGRNLKNVGE